MEGNEPLGMAGRIAYLWEGWVDDRDEDAREADCGRNLAARQGSRCSGLTKQHEQDLSCGSVARNTIHQLVN